jgi:hypothetical protein
MARPLRALVSVLGFLTSRRQFSTIQPVRGCLQEI